MCSLCVLCEALCEGNGEYVCCGLVSNKLFFIDIISSVVRSRCHCWHLLALDFFFDSTTNTAIQNTSISKNNTDGALKTCSLHLFTNCKWTITVSLWYETRPTSINRLQNQLYYKLQLSPEALFSSKIQDVLFQRSRHEFAPRVTLSLFVELFPSICGRRLQIEG